MQMQINSFGGPMKKSSMRVVTLVWVVFSFFGAPYADPDSDADREHANNSDSRRPFPPAAQPHSFIRPESAGNVALNVLTDVVFEWR